MKKNIQIQIESYLELSLEIKELEMLKSSLAAQILEFLDKEQIKSWDHSEFRVTRCIRRRYHYPEAIVTQEESLKELKKQFESTSEDFETTQYLSVKSLKLK